MKKTPLFKVALTALVLIGSAIVSTAIMTTPASADVAASKAAVDSAKSKGVVGEANTGYLAFVTASSDSALKAAVDEINAGRHEVFAQAAAKNGVSVEVAGVAAYSASILPKLKAGEYYQDGSGKWVQK